MSYLAWQQYLYGDIEGIHPDFEEGIPESCSEGLPPEDGSSEFRDAYYLEKYGRKPIKQKGVYVWY